MKTDDMLTICDCNDCRDFRRAVDFRMREHVLESARKPAAVEAPAVVIATPRLPLGATERKALPLMTGVLDYFIDALCAIAAVSVAGNEQHNPGEELHWARGKSTDQADTIVRHLADRGLIDNDGHRHSAKAAWRCLALLQLEIEEAEGKTPPRGCR